MMDEIKKDTGEEFPFVHYVKILIANFRIIAIASVAAALLFFGASLLVKPVYKAKAVLLPPASAASELGKLSLLLPGGVQKTTPSLAALAILKSRTLMERVVSEFRLDSIYDAKNMEEAVEALDKNSNIYYARNDGVINIEVYDEDPRRAADIANIFVQEAEKINEKLQIFLEKPMLKVVDKAIPPEKKARPKRGLITIAGFFLGILLSCGVVIYRDLKNGRIYDFMQIVRLGYNPPVFTIPRIKKLDKNPESYTKLWVPEKDVAYFLSHWEREKVERTPGLILVTSGREKEGKTLASIQLALILSSTGEKCILVDMNHLNPCIDRIFALSEADKENVDGVIQKPMDLPFDITRCRIEGIREAAERISGLREKFSEYSYIIVDAPPLLRFPPLIKVLSTADSVFLVVRLAHALVEDLATCDSIFRDSGVERSSIVVNCG